MLAAIHVEVQRDWAEFALSFLVAVGTLLAVAVALFGPRWSESRKRPRIALVADRSESRHLDSRHMGDMVLDFPVLWITNQRQRDPGREVEVLATIGEYHGGGVHGVPISRENLVFRDPRKSHPPDHIVQVPPGCSREVFFLLAGPKKGLLEAFEKRPDLVVDDAGYGAAFVIHPVRQDNICWLRTGRYSVTFTITGANFDAVQYTARFSFSISEPEPNHPVLDFAWVQAPTRIRVTDPEYVNPRLAEGWVWPGDGPFPAARHSLEDVERCPYRGCSARNWPWQTDCWRCHRPL